MFLSTQKQSEKFCMHTSAMLHGQLFFQTYLKNKPGAIVVAIGAQDVNGSLKSVCPPSCKYIGVDFISGKGIDVVLEDPYKLPFEDGSVDAVVSSSCLEHSELFWLSFLEMLRILKPGGLCYLNVPSNGEFHRFPVDCWRFYPDSGNALVTWAKRNNYPTVLLESFTGNQATSGEPSLQQWSDYIAVFLKDEAQISDYPDRILDTYRLCENAYLHGKEGFQNHQTHVEDKRRLFSLIKFAKKESPMHQTPSHEQHNPDLLAVIPLDAKRIVEVGCSSGALAREYKKINRNCHYMGVEVNSEYARLAERHCDAVVELDIEDVDENLLRDVFSCDCWIFGDTLEHLKDPWLLLGKIRKTIPDGGSIVACIPNAQHWSVQAKLNCGNFRYEDSGLMDKTHLRWFTRLTIFEMFQNAGFEIIQEVPRIFNEPDRVRVLSAIRLMASSIGADPEMAVNDALPLQYVVRATPVLGVLPTSPMEQKGAGLGWLLRNLFNRR